MKLQTEKLPYVKPQGKKHLLDGVSHACGTMVCMQLVLLAGAAGTALAHALAAHCNLTVVAPTTRDSWADGLKRCPDLDAFLRPERPATSGVTDTLVALGFGTSWQHGDDTEIALRIIRTELLHAGYDLTSATHAIALRRGLPFEVLPLSNDRGELHVVLTDDEGSRAVHLDDVAAQHKPDEPTLVTAGWAITPEVTEAVAAAASVVIINSTDPVVAHAVSAIKASVPQTRFVDAQGHRAEQVLSAVEALR